MEFAISLYGYMLLAALALGFVSVAHGLKKRGVPGRIIVYSIFLNVALTLYGAKLYTVVSSGFQIDWFRAGISSLGGAMGLLAGVFLFGKIYGRDSKLFFHLYALAIPGMYGVSKIGCYTAGCCHGIPYDGPLSVVYQNDVAQTGAVFPIQLVESMVFLGIFFAGSRLYERMRSDAAVGIVMLLCAVCKFSLEYLRAEHIGVILSMNQIVCIVFAAWALLLILNGRTEKLDRESRQASRTEK